MHIFSLKVCYVLWDSLVNTVLFAIRVSSQIVIKCVSFLFNVRIFIVVKFKSQTWILGAKMCMTLRRFSCLLREDTFVCTTDFFKFS